MKLSESVFFLLSSQLLLVADVTTQSTAQVQLNYQVHEEVEVGTVVGDVRGDYFASRRDLDVTVTREFRMFSSNVTSFGIDLASGLLRVASHLDREALLNRDGISCDAHQCHVGLHVAVKPGVTSQIEVVEVTIEVKDINDNPPRFGKSTVALQVLESAQPQRTTLALPLATDPDGLDFQIKRYELQPKNGAILELQLRAG